MALTTMAILAGTYVCLRTQTKYVARDVAIATRYIPVLGFVRNASWKTTWSFVDCWRDTVSRNPNKIFITYIGDDDSVVKYTYNQVEELSNKVANFLHGSNVSHGSVVALMMDNKPEYIITWLGIIKVGATAALINTYITGSSLLHSLVTSNANIFIIGAEHLDTVSALRRELVHQKDKTSDNKIPQNIQFYVVGRDHVDGFQSLDTLIKDMPITLTGGFCPKRGPWDSIFYIYTSGTTGLPKASIITHIRAISASSAFYYLYCMNPNDVYYCSLPFYHSSATLITICSSIFGGMSVVFRRKFSASHFWSDCSSHNATIAQYIGELCHYLLEKPPSPLDQNHKVRLMVGNGLRPNIWEKFQSRFGIKQIGEFYLATEGTASLFNTINKPGAVGFIPPLIQFLYPLSLIKYDTENDVNIRDDSGFCVPCKDGEVGQLISEIKQNGSPVFDYRGYTNKEATEKKILRDVFKKGDCWFSSGDLLKKDSDGFYYFVDRVGDTFRWKGENVATGEVEGILKDFPGVKDVSVYGVQVPNTPGRAGMAFLVVEQKIFDIKAFYDFTHTKLPSFAVPMFVRIGKEVELTSTLKHMKNNKRTEGFDPKIIKDPLYFRDTKSKEYIPITPQLYHKLVSLEAKL